ncbi:hypothetical protein GOARA_050_00130 [Gordonia araii NBRC 100433]|uniref:Uncharacterized protein n=1 Tax=Gordonia araii NBRC 100433 TaxID=1073574 RepID=G7H276_9ACTN|nr:hypothetical protein [Gordonia araii]NNG97490.1 hypothetical protein [Gordonia araii NBRC 100433]GAB09951.1 hypothetical protein GOARA_050_00130 [Gordonia araii NBRC 100433]
MTTGAISTAHEWVDSRTTTQSRSGAVTVTTTAQGLPVAIRLADSAMRLGADALASQVLALCEQGRIAASVRLRELLAADGVDDEVLATMSLATTDDLARVQAVDDEQACAPRTWFR